jgi:hypothetical protein
MILLLTSLPGFATEMKPGKDGPFRWNRDRLWRHLEQQFVDARSLDCADLHPVILSRLDALTALTTAIEARPLGSTNPLWDDAENLMLALAPLLATCPDHLTLFIEGVARLQRAVKAQAVEWPAQAAQTRQRLYRMIYGGRSAIEEILLQSPSPKKYELIMGINEPSGAPSIKVHGITIHSGDMLVSRGGAATSALIARGSDYPGNFSHAALVHVDAQTGKACVIEALIESGVVISTVEHFLEDKKLRIMVLRLRPDLPAVVLNPAIAHEAAQYAFDLARNNRIAYDFAMDFRNHDKLFCAEVVYAAFEKVGISLWSGLSRISADGTARWLEAFGVKNFITLEPSDLEYDPQLIRVVEWHNPQTLLEDHIHNAATDVLLEGANAGAPLNYNRLMLPVTWGVKVYSILQTKRGHSGPIPNGMSATAALRNRWYTKQHAGLVGRLNKAVGTFRQQKGYTPPYWELVRMARELR